METPLGGITELHGDNSTVVRRPQQPFHSMSVLYVSLVVASVTSKRFLVSFSS